MIQIIVDPHPTLDMLDGFWTRAWGSPPHANYENVLRRSLAHLGAYEADRLVGFVNVAWDGGVHAFILDTAVDPDFRRKGVASELVARAAQLAGQRGAEWLHVDYEPHLAKFYEGCGFRPTKAGLIRLT